MKMTSVSEIYEKRAGMPVLPQHNGTVCYPYADALD